MGHEKAIASGKEHRKPYRGSKRMDVSMLEGVKKMREKDPDVSTFSGRLGANLRRIRKEKGWESQYAADLIGVPRNTLTRWETGDRTPSIENIFDLKRVYGVTLDDIFPEGESNEKKAS